MNNEESNLEPTPLEIGNKAPSLKEVYYDSYMTVTYKECRLE